MKRALAFNGGKDSWACLWLLHDAGLLDDTTVLWADLGKNFPEALAVIERARAMCRHWVTISVDRDAQIRQWGLPSDVVPVDWTVEGQRFSGPKPVTIQPYLRCTHENVGRPLHEYAVRHGFTHVVRGQRREDSHHAPVDSGFEADGVVYLHPIEDWTSEDVLRFVGRHMDLPDHFRFRHTSLDCYDCPAYRADRVDVVAWMKDAHPDLHAEYLTRKQQVDGALRQAMADQGV